MRKKKLGTTMIEILTVIALLALLTMFSIFWGGQLTKRARDADRKSDMADIKTILYDYYVDAGCFPKTLPSCGEDFKAGNNLYYSSFPCDPLSKNYAHEVEEAECSSWFKILTDLENQSDPAIERVGCTDGCGPECEYNYGLSSTNILVSAGCEPEPVHYVCAPGGQCEAFDDPEISECPFISDNDPSCGGADACVDHDNRCKNSKGKTIPK